MGELVKLIGTVVFAGQIILTARSGLLSARTRKGCTEPGMQEVAVAHMRMDMAAGKAAGTRVRRPHNLWNGFPRLQAGPRSSPGLRP